MINSNLLEILRLLRPEEKKEIIRWLASPSFYFEGGATTDLILLFRVITSEMPEFLEDPSNKENFYAKVYPNEPFVRGRMDKLMVELSKVLKYFILGKQYFSEHNEARQQIDWSVWLRNRGALLRSRKVLSKMKLKAESDLESLENYRLSLQIVEEEHEWESVQNQVKGDLAIPQLIHQLDLYYYNYRTELVNRYLLQQKAANLPVLNLKDLNLDLYTKQSAHLQFTQQIQALFSNTHPTNEDFSVLLARLKNWEQKFSFQTRAHFYAYLRSACTLLINQGYDELQTTLHQIHKENLDRGYFHINQSIGPSAYLNLVYIAVRAKDYVWAKNFITTYKDRILGGDEGRVLYRLNTAVCLFAEQEFDAALNILPEAPSNSHYHHMVRRLELKIYYETRSDLLLYKIDAFRKFIERTAPKTIAPNLREMDVNFLNILLQLAQSPPKDKARSIRLTTRIESKKLIADRLWLLEKAKALG